MSEQNPDYATIRGRIENGVKRQKRFYRIVFFLTHLLFFVLTMAMVWGTVAYNEQLRNLLFDQRSGASIVVILPTILWSAVLLFHLAALYFESAAGEQAIRERLLMREISKDMLRQEFSSDGMAEKPKRYDAVSEAERVFLSDDGELVAVDEDQPFEQSDYSAHARRAGSS